VGGTWPTPSTASRKAANAILAAGGSLLLRFAFALAGAGAPLCTVHAQAPGELAYALDYAAANPAIIAIEDE